MTSQDKPKCCRCGGPPDGEVKSGYPEKRWDWWCRRCLIEAREEFRRECDGQRSLFEP